MLSTHRNRFVYAGLTLLVLLLGLASRRFLGDVSFIRAYVGDALWAMMVFFGFAVFFRRWSTKAVAVTALAFSFGIEFSQFYHAPWIEQVRATRLGGLVLGFSFVGSDLLCYSVGIALGVLLDQYFIANQRRIKLT